MRSLDYAKYAQLYKNNGVWNGNQIVSKEWIQKTFTHQIQIPERENEFYSYLFWNKSVEYKGKHYETYLLCRKWRERIYHLQRSSPRNHHHFKSIQLTLRTSASRKDCKRFYFAFSTEIRITLNKRIRLICETDSFYVYPNFFFLNQKNTPPKSPIIAKGSNKLNHCQFVFSSLIL